MEAAAGDDAIDVVVEVEMFVFSTHLERVRFRWAPFTLWYMTGNVK